MGIVWPNLFGPGRKRFAFVFTCTLIDRLIDQCVSARILGCESYRLKISVSEKQLLWRVRSNCSNSSSNGFDDQKAFKQNEKDGQTAIIISIFIQIFGLNFNVLKSSH